MALQSVLSSPSLTAPQLAQGISVRLHTVQPARLLAANKNLSPYPSRARIAIGVCRAVQSEACRGGPGGDLHAESPVSEPSIQPSRKDLSDASEIRESAASPTVARRPELQLFSNAAAAVFVAALADAESGGTGYSLASYYTSLGLFVISLPGLYSLIKRSTKSKVVRRTYEVPGPAVPGAKPLAAIAGEITAFLNRNNYKVVDMKETVTFEGTIVPSKSQAAFLVFCTALSLAAVALVLSIAAPLPEPLGGEAWYGLVALSPLTGLYYWQRSQRTEQVQVKMVTADDERSADVIIQGSDEEVERLRRELKLMEKGMVYVKGIFEM